jgi:hypothetical protein
MSENITVSSAALPQCMERVDSVVMCFATDHAVAMAVDQKPRNMDTDISPSSHAIEDQPLGRLWRNRDGNADAVIALSQRLSPCICPTPQRHFTLTVRCREERPAVDCVPEGHANRVCSGRDKCTVIHSTTSGAPLPGRSTSRSQPWTGHRSIGCRGQSTAYATTQPAAKPCALSPLAVLLACSLASGQRTLGLPALSGGTAAHATESAVAILTATSSVTLWRVPVTAVAIVAAAGRTPLAPATATAAGD